jgi:hypothetical protein
MVGRFPKKRKEQVKIRDDESWNFEHNKEDRRGTSNVNREWTAQNSNFHLFEF